MLRQRTRAGRCPSLTELFFGFLFYSLETGSRRLTDALAELGAFFTWSVMHREYLGNFLKELMIIYAFDSKRIDF